MKYEKIGRFVSLRQGLAINKASNHLVSEKKDEIFIYPLLRIADMMENKYTKYISKDVNHNVIAYQDDIIYTRTGQIGLVFRNFKGVVHNNSFIVSIENDELDKDYLFVLLQSEFVRKQALSLAHSSVQPDLTHDMFKSITIPIPEKEIQKEIAKSYLRLGKKIENNTHIISELESMVKTIYDYWFLQYEFPNEKEKPYKSSGGKMVYNEELKKEIPEGWEIGKCKDIVEVITGKEDANFATPNGKYKFFTCSQDISLCDIPKFKGSAVLIAGNGDFNVKHYTGEFNAYQRTYVLIPSETKYYSLLYISALYKIKSFQKGSNGSIVKFITKGDIEDIELIIPNNNKLLYKLNQYIFTIEKIKEENEELAKLRDELLPLLMNGQVSFKN